MSQAEEREPSLTELIAAQRAQISARGASGVTNGADADMFGNIQAVEKGVTASWLAIVFRMELTEVKRRLRNCRAIGIRGKTQFLYDLREAATYLVDPKVTTDEFLARANAGKLPPKLQNGYWDAKTRKLRYEIMAGELWPTEQVVGAISRLFKTIKNETQLWVTDLGRKRTLSPEQRAYFEERVDGLQLSIFDVVREIELEAGNVLHNEKRDDPEWDGHDDQDDHSDVI